MKRILYIMSAVVAFNLFFLLFINESEKQFKSLSYFPTQLSTYTHTDYFMATIDADNETSDEMYETIYTYITENESIALSSRIANVQE